LAFGGGEQADPVARLAQPCRAQALPDQRILADMGGREMRIGAVPEAGRHLLGARPALEAVAVARAVEEQEARRREALRVAPHAGQAPGSLGDEVLEV